MAEKGERVKRLARYVVVENLKKVSFAWEEKGGGEWGSRSLKAISPSLAGSTPSGDVRPAPLSLTQATPFPLSAILNHTLR